jgi:hypothetical protein
MSATRTIPTEHEIWSWHRTLSNWGRWGVDDERGTLNLITPAKRLQAAQLVREGLIVSCARTIGYESAADNAMPARHFMPSSSESYRRVLAAAARRVHDPSGCPFAHSGAPGYFTTWTTYDGKPAKAVTASQGATVGSVERAGGGILSRGVLLDIPRLRGVPWLEGSDPIYPEDLDAAEVAQGVGQSLATSCSREPDFSGVARNSVLARSAKAWARYRLPAFHGCASGTWRWLERTRVMTYFRCGTHRLADRCMRSVLARLACGFWTIPTTRSCRRRVRG